MRPTVLCFAVALLVHGVPVRAQIAPTPVSLASGTRVRVTTSGTLALARQAGRVLANRPDTLSLQPDGSVESLALPWAAVSDLEVSRGRQRATLRGFGIGVLVGALSGAVIGAATYEKPKPSGGCGGTQEFCITGPLFDVGRGGSAAILGGLGAVVGGAAGALIGHAHQREIWEKVPLRLQPALLHARPTHIAADAMAPGATISLALRF